MRLSKKFGIKSYKDRYGTKYFNVGTKKTRIYGFSTKGSAIKFTKGKAFKTYI